MSRETATEPPSASGPAANIDADAFDSAVDFGIESDSESDLDIDPEALVSVRIHRAVTDPVVLPHRSGRSWCAAPPENAPPLIRETIVPARFRLLGGGGAAPIAVATWPETVAWLSELSLKNAAITTGDNAHLYGRAFRRFVERHDIGGGELPGSVSTIMPEAEREDITERLRQIRRHIRACQNEHFLEERYPDLDLDIPRSYWKLDAPLTDALAEI